MKALKNSKDLLQDIKKQGFYENGLNFVVNNLCPFCDTVYDSHSLLTHVKEKTLENKKANLLKSNVQSGCSILASDYQALIHEIDEIKRAAVVIDLTDEAEKLIVLSEKIKQDCYLLNKFIDRLENVEILIKNPYGRFDNTIFTALDKILGDAEKIPNSSTEDEAKCFLIIADERLNKYKVAKREKNVWEARSKITANVLSEFEAVSEKKLTDLYEEVETDFSEFYSKINNSDEKDFSAQLTHNKGSLNLEVDFYGRGVFPPNAFHSEGHQDGMGLCLYLALSKKMLGNRFTFCLLDDVLMSVDTNHRREFCRLLKSKFPSTQFIITTHDEIWKKQLISEKLVNYKRVINFRGWSVDNGPSCLNEEDTIEALDRCVKNENILEAAPILRQYLEYIMTELSYKFRVKLERNLNNSYELGELSDAVISRYKELLKKAKTAANSWNQTYKVNKIENIDASFIDAIGKTKIEQWALNSSVHYNEWANFTPNDFLLLQETFFDLLNQFKCPDCHSWLYVSPSKYNVEMVKCECGKFLLNLKLKK